MKGRYRNALCWCGSGKKYKKCHQNRIDQPKDNPWDAVDFNRKAFSKKHCFARDAGLGPCEGNVIKAHTVSRGSNLAKIAVDGHVLHHTAAPSELKKNGGKIYVEKIGIKDASVFYGFCSKHDRELFSCIENEPFTGRPDQCLAIAYRTMSRELYGKDAAAHLRETLRGADKGMQPFEQVVMQKWLEAIETGNEAARREARATHDVLTSAIAKNQPATICSLVLVFDAPLPFMFAGAWSPFTDFYGNNLQDGNSDQLLEQVFFSSFAAEDGGMICISWRDIDKAPGKIIAEQINNLPSDQQASACLQIATKHLENIFFDPRWFESLAREQREQLLWLASDGLDIMGSAPSSTIRLKMNFHLPLSLKSFRQ